MIKKKPLISVVIPAYNEEKYLPSCLNALKHQTFDNFEIIVVDNNSTDETARIARSFGAKLYREKKQGIARARECGFKYAKAEIIVRTDADSIPPSDWLEKIYYAFQIHPQIIALTGSLTSPNRYFPTFIIKLYTLLLVKLTILLTGHISLHGPNFALKKTAWEKTEPHLDDKLVHEDIDLACHLSEFGEMLFIPKITVAYSLRRLRKHPLDFLIEYPMRYIKTLRLHHPIFPAS